MNGDELTFYRIVKETRRIRHSARRSVLFCSPFPRCCLPAANSIVGLKFYARFTVVTVSLLNVQSGLLFCSGVFSLRLCRAPLPAGHRWPSECESGACESNQRLQQYIAIASQSRKSDYIHYHFSPFVQRPSRISMRPALRSESAKRKLRKFNSTNKKRITGEYFFNLNPARSSFLL